MPKDDKLLQELTEMRWRVLPTGKVAIEEKDALRVRIGRSPDRADALAMALARERRPHATVFAVAV